MLCFLNFFCLNDVQAFTNGDGKEMSPKTHLNSDLNEFKEKFRIWTEDSRG